jgi:Putative Ig domain
VAHFDSLSDLNLNNTLNPALPDGQCNGRRTVVATSLRSLAAASGSLLFALLAGCSGGGSNPPVTPITITTTTLNQGTTSTAYSATLAATGGSGTYTWSLASGSNLPAGLQLSAAGVITGTPTTAGLGSFTVNVEDSETAPQTASASLKLAISGGTLGIKPPLPPGGQVGVSYSFQLAAQGGVPPYTWSTANSTSLPPGLTLDSTGALSGTPTTAGNFTTDFQVTDSASTSFSQNGPITISPAGESLPNGGYAFSFSGTGPNGAVVINGSFLVSNQAVGAGVYDENLGSGGPHVNQQLVGGSVTIGANGLGQLTLQLATSETVTFALAVPASIATSGNDTNIPIIEFDDKTGSGTRGSGVLKTSNVGDGSAIVNNYAFSLSGVDSSQNRVAIVGSFNADGAGNIKGYAADANDNGAITSETAFTGTYSVTDFRGTMQLKLSGNSYNYSFYQVTPGELLAISTDTLSANVPLVSGLIEQQTGTFSTTSLKGIGVLETNGLAALSGTLVPDVTLGLATADGNGNLGVTYDEYKGQLLTPQTFSGTYSVDANSGRVALKSTGTPTVLYLLDNNEAFVLGGDASASSGLLEPQSGTGFSNSSFKGNYLGGSLPLNSASAMNEVALIVPDGSGNVTITYDNSGPKGLVSNTTTTGTYSVGSNGRTVVTAADGTTRVFYVVSPTKAALLSGEGQGYLGSFEQ